MIKKYEALSAEETSRLLNELQVHQLELEMQNEELLRAKGELAVSQARYFELYDLAPVGYCTLNEQGVILEANLTASNLLGVTREALVKQPLASYVSFEDQDTYYLYHKRLMGTRSRQVCELRLRTAGSAACWVRLEATFVQQGECLCRVAISDITELKKVEEEKKSLEERLHRAEKMEAIGNLAGGVAHDLNNLLGVLKGNAQILLEDMGKSDPMRELAEDIVSSSERAALVVQDLLTMAHRVVVLREPASLNRIVADLLKTAESRKLFSSYPQITMETEYGSDILDINVSVSHIERTVLNLIVNALRAMPENGKLTLRTENRYLERNLMAYEEVPKGDYVVLSMSDTGSGIPPEHIKRLFEPFYMRKVLKKGGTGLGLSLVWGTIKDHDGYIDVDSDPGRGTTISLYFPALHDNNISWLEHSFNEYMGHGETVLVVDDDESQCRLAERMLTRLSYRVKTAASGEEALEYLQNNNADIVVLDMIMESGMDGYDTYRRMREIKKNQKAIIFSGFAKTERVKMAQELGAGEFIMKPYLLERLGMALTKELKRKSPDSRLKK